MRWRARSLAGQLFVLQGIVVCLVVLVAAGLALLDERRDTETRTRERVLDLARTLASAPDVAAALRGPEPTRTLQPLAEEVRAATGVDFVVVMSPAGVRYSHPDPAQIGGRYLGTIAPALAGTAHAETFTGTLGPSVRAVAPVRGTGGGVDGLVAVGVTTAHVGEELARQVPAVVGAAATGLALAALTAALAARWLRRRTHGLGPAQITRMYEHHDAVLHAMREGLLVVDRGRRLQLANDEARRLLDLPSTTSDPGPDAGPDATSDAGTVAVAELRLPTSLSELLASGREAFDEIHLTGDRVLVVSQAQASWAGRTLGTVTTLRDHTELRALTGELDSVRGFAESLRAQAHEAANRLHTVITLVELGRGQEAVEFATAELAAAQELTDRLMAAVDEPVLVALLLGKAAEAAERGVELDITSDTALHRAAIDPRDLVTIVGNLVDNALDAALAAPPPRRVGVTVRSDDAELLVRVTDTGSGLDPATAAQAFRRGWSTKPADRPHGRGLGLALVGQAVNRYAGSIAVTGERGAVFTVRLPLPSESDAAPRLAGVGR